MSGPQKLDPTQQIVFAVGVFVVKSQELEQLFKYLVPMMNSGDPSLGSILDRHAAIAKKSLGMVAGQFVSAASGDIGALQDYVQQVVRERNEVVHHFSRTFGPLIASGKQAEALSELRKRQERASSLTRVLRELALCVTDALRDVTFAGTEQYAEMAEFCRCLRASWKGNGSAIEPPRGALAALPSFSTESSS